MLFVIESYIKLLYFIWLAFGESPYGFTEGRIPIYRKKEKRRYREKRL
jgi:hypothetical protein